MTKSAFVVIVLPVAIFLLLPFNVSLSKNIFDSHTTHVVNTVPRKLDNNKLDSFIRKIDKNVKGAKGAWRFKIKGRLIIIITDEKANRMRIISPIGSSKNLDKKVLYRMMQANFDTSHDARYAIAKEVVWATFMHPLASLSEKALQSAIVQVVQLANSFGKTYSSGLFIFKAGDTYQKQKSQKKKSKKDNKKLSI